VDGARAVLVWYEAERAGGRAVGCESERYK
jgi:hypothetical protein